VGKFLADRPTLRGFLILGAIVLLIVVLNLYTAAAAIGMLLRIAFFLAVAFFIFLMWRERRDEISSWSQREIVVFYGAALSIVGALGLYFWHGWPRYEELGFIAVIACSGFAMWRVWRDRHHYST
jgi:small-conductance mechanosensitive channel